MVRHACSSIADPKSKSASSTPPSDAVAGAKQLTWLGRMLPSIWRYQIFSF